MGNSKSKTSKPPAYEEINENKLTPVICDKPIKYEDLLNKYNEFKQTQLAEYERYNKLANQYIITNINNEFLKSDPKNIIAKGIFTISAIYNEIPIQYRDDTLNKLYLKKHVDFVRKMYSKFKITTNESYDGIYYEIRLK